MTTASSRAFGTGWLSGVVSIALGAVGLAAVFCFHFPSLLTFRSCGPVPVPVISALLHLVLVWSFIAGVISVCLRRRKILGMTGISLTLVAALLGGSRVPIDGELQSGPFLGLDWFRAESDRVSRRCSCHSSASLPDDRSRACSGKVGAPISSTFS